MTELEFISAPAAAALVARDPQTIRNWAAAGRVRRRLRGRLVEYHMDDVWAAAGHPTSVQRQVEQLQQQVEQLQRQLQQQTQQAQQAQQQLVDLVAAWDAQCDAGRVLLLRYGALVGALLGMLTRREQREDAERLSVEVVRWEWAGVALRRQRE